MRNKICLIYNYAQHYRTNIFVRMDKEFDIDFVFGDSMCDVKKMDYSLISGKITETHTKYLCMNMTWQPKVISNLFMDYNCYILLGETRSISTWLFCILARLFKPQKKVYFWSHAWYGKENNFERFLKKVLFRLPNGGIFCYGNYARQLMIKEGFNASKLFTIHNSLAYDQQISIRNKLKQSFIYQNHFGNNNKNLFFVGRLTPVKKLEQILRAMLICQNNGSHYNLTLIGGGEMLNKLELLAKELGLLRNIWFYGPCYDELELSSLIYNADLCVAPGNIGLTAMHSMVFGTPCITHNDFPYQMPEFEAIIEGTTGCFFKRDDINDLANKIDNWFSLNENKRDEVRDSCMKEIDMQWNPNFQIDVFRNVLK